MRGPDHTTPAHDSSHHEQSYTFGYSHAAMQIMMGRTAENSATSVLPHVRPGVRAVDGTKGRTRWKATRATRGCRSR